MRMTDNRALDHNGLGSESVGHATVEPPRLLYKYRSLRNGNDFNKFTLDLLESGTVYFSNASSLNDPHEFRPRVRAWKPRSKVRTRFDHLAQKYADYIRAAYDMERYGQLPEEQKQEVHDAAVENLLSLVDEKGFMRPALLDRMSGYFGILSLTADPTNTLMWAHYADSHKGVCVGLSTDLRPLSLARPVHYLSEVPVIAVENISYSDIVAAYKSTTWAYEGEWRVLKRGPGIVRLGPKAVRELIFGFACPDAMIIEVVQRLRKVNCNPKLFRIKREEHRFIFKKSRIDVAD